MSYGRNLGWGTYRGLYRVLDKFSPGLIWVLGQGVQSSDLVCGPSGVASSTWRKDIERVKLVWDLKIKVKC